jgi:hypothetical protein
MPMGVPRPPNQRSWTVYLFNGDSYRVFDGRNGWWAGPDSPSPIETLTSGNLDRSRLEVMMPFTWTVSQTYMQMAIKLDEVKLNVPVDAARFARPAPATPKP